MCPKKRFASKWFGYEYKVKLLFSRQLVYTHSISSSKWRLTPSVPILGAVYLFLSINIQDMYILSQFHGLRYSLIAIYSTFLKHDCRRYEL